MTNTNLNRPILNISDVAKLFGIEESTARIWASKKLIPGYKIGKSWFFNRGRVLEAQSIIDSQTYYDDNLSLSGCKPFDLLSKDGRLEVKSSLKQGKSWRFSGLHDINNSDYYLFLCYSEDRKILRFIYRIPSKNIKDYKKRTAVVLREGDESLSKYLVYKNDKNDFKKGDFYEEENIWLTIDQAAQRIGVPLDLINHYINKSCPPLPTYQLSDRIVRINRDELDQWIIQHNMQDTIQVEGPEHYE